MLFQLYFYIRYLLAPLRWIRSKKKGLIAKLIQQSPVSVIIAARNEEYNLKYYLHKILQQDYPEYEVIVVDDGSDDQTTDILNQMQRDYPHLRHTFVPHNTRLVSTKKLALTLGAKAAQYDYLVLTDADCVPSSDHWLQEIMSAFTGNTEVVLAYGAYFKQPQAINSLIQYDTLFNSLQYLGMAINKKPYMGVGRNLAYTKQLFFSSGGFSHIAFNRAGDDDLFVNHVATGNNTNVIITPQSITFSPPKTSLKQWLHQKRRHLSVAPKYKVSTKFILALEPLSRFIFILEIVALSIAAYYYSLWYLYIVAAGCFALKYLLQIFTLNLSAHKLGLPCINCLLIPVYDLFLPLNNMILMLINSFKKTNIIKQQW